MTLKNHAFLWFLRHTSKSHDFRPRASLHAYLYARDFACCVFVFFFRSRALLYIARYYSYFLFSTELRFFFFFLTRDGWTQNGKTRQDYPRREMIVHILAAIGARVNGFAFYRRKTVDARTTTAAFFRRMSTIYCSIFFRRARKLVNRQSDSLRRALSASSIHIYRHACTYYIPVFIYLLVPVLR